AAPALAPNGRVLVRGAWKGSAAMAASVVEILGDRVTGGLVVVKDGYARRAGPVRIVEASHPVPDERGRAAAVELLRLAESAGPADPVVCAISGGGSALLPAPAPPTTLPETSRPPGRRL